MMIGTDILEPVGASAAGCDNNSVGKKFLAVPEPYAETLSVFDHKILALASKQDFDAVIQKILLNVIINFLCPFGTKMSDRAVDKLQSRPDGPLTDILDGCGIPEPFNLAVRSKLKVNTVDIVDGILHGLLADKLRQVAADFGRQRQLSIRKCAGPGKSGCDMAVGLAVEALMGAGLGANPFFNRQPLFKNSDTSVCAPPNQLNGGENASRSCADNDDVWVHGNLPLQMKRGRCTLPLF
ncbi:hypothetical protein SDC9_65935 [bioreactor metagenome]|uniref:Uncharacterized protein n=1 Tax=bioreactor metagenome TaxID=1076179 RepID=A0A644XTU4_9ZZZZ